MAPRTYKPTVKPGPGTYVQQPVTSPSKSPTIYRWGQPNPGMAAGAQAQAAPKAPTASTAPAAPSAPSPPSAPTSAVLPPDPTYDQQIGAYSRNRDTTVSGLAGQRTQGLLNYGYNEDPNGALAFDPTNPYSQAAQMKLRYDQSRQATGNNMAARGQLYAGAYQQGQDIINRGQGKSEDALQKALIAFLAGNTGAKARAQTTYETQAAQAAADRVGRASSSPLYSPSAEATPAAAAAPAPAAAAAQLPIYSKKPGSKGLGYGSRR